MEEEREEVREEGMVVENSTTVPEVVEEREVMVEGWEEEVEENLEEEEAMLTQMEEGS